MRIWGISIGEESAFLARRIAGSVGVDYIKIIPLDAHLPREKALQELFATMAETSLFELDDHVHFSLFSHNLITFVTDLDRSITEIDTTLSWELGQRIEGDVTKYALSYSKINNHRYLVAGIPSKELSFVTKKFHRLGVEAVTVDVDAIAALQSLELNGMVGQSYIYIHAGIPSSTLIIIREGSIRALRTVNSKNKEEAVAHLLGDGRSDYPDITHYLVAGEAISSTEALDSILRSNAHGSSVNPFHVIPYSGELAADQVLSLITSAVGLSQKAV